jgi:hypothetical protein
MPFSIATFRQHLTAANSRFSRIKTSSMAPLDNQLAILGAGVNAGSLAQLQPLWGAVPYAKQQKYVAAGNYLKQFVPTLVDAIPVQPKMAFIELRVLPGNIDGVANYPARIYHVHELTWKSSNGNMQSLTNVGTREKVDFRSNPTSPPFDPIVNSGLQMSYTQGATTNAGANIGSCKDDHSIANPSILTRRPLSVGSLVADQVYEYTTDGITWHPIPGSQYEIEKGVRNSRNGHVFVFRKQGVGSDNFHFEVEYTIGPKPNYAKKVPVIAAAYVPVQSLRQFASRVVANR